VRFLRSLLFLAVILMAIAPALEAQDQNATPLQWGAFKIQGTAGVGYRFTDVKGYEPMFMELYNLRKGPRVSEFNLFGRSDGTNPFADTFSLTTSGLGGDPYPSAQLSLSKSKVYDLRANWRQSYFYWNQNDGIILPTRGTTGLTDNHDWATVRKIGSVDLTLHATDNLRFNFEYYRTTFSGATYTTFSPYFFGQSDSLGGFARANAYYTYSPTFDNTNRFTGGFDYTYRHFNFHYNVGYQTFTENMTFNNVTSPQRAIDTTTKSTATQLLSNATWSDFRELKTPVSEFSYNGQPTSKLSVRGTYMFYRYRGPATIDRSFSGNNPDPYQVSESGRAEVTEPNHIVEQGFTYTINPWWNLDFDYRFRRFTTTTEGMFYSQYNDGTPNEGESANDWEDTLHQFDFSMMFTPKSNLIIRPGVSFYHSDIKMFEDGTLDDARSLITKNVSPIVSIFYRPTSRLSLRGEVHTYNRGSSYTALTPHTDVTTRLVAQYRLSDKVSVSNELYTVSQKLLATDFHGRVRANTTMLTYSPNQNYSVFGGFTYDSEFASGVIAWQRGVPEPQTIETGDALRDQAINRVWMAGLELKPVKRFGIRFTGNYERTTGLGEEAGIEPVYGPLTFPYATGTVYYDFPKAGRFSVDLHRTYYIQQITPGNNFSANMLTIRWTRSF
jgi:hypothetical protein